MSISKQYERYVGGKWNRSFGYDDTDVPLKNVDKTDFITREIKFQLAMHPALKDVSLLDEMVYGKPVDVKDPDRIVRERMRAEFASHIAEEKKNAELMGEHVSREPAPPSMTPRFENGKILDIKA